MHKNIWLGMNLKSVNSGLAETFNKLKWVKWCIEAGKALLLFLGCMHTSLFKTRLCASDMCSKHALKMSALVIDFNSSLYPNYLIYFSFQTDT